MRIERFTIDYPKSPAERKRWNRHYGLNAIYAGKHWAKRNEDKEYWHNMVRSAMSRAGVPKKPFEKPVRISFWWNDNLDLDNSAYERKMIIDSLRGWIIQDDRKKYVRELRDNVHDEDCILVEVKEISNGR